MKTKDLMGNIPLLYEKPKCECNSSLKINRVKKYREYGGISIFSLLPRIFKFNGIDLILVCPVCKRRYQSETDKYGRIKKGEAL